MTSQDYIPRTVLVTDATEGITHDGADALKLDIDGLTVAAIDGSADYLVFWDATDGTHKRVLGNNLPGGGGGGGAPTDAQYVVAAANGTLTAERVLTDTADIVWDTATSGQMKASLADAKLSLANGGFITGQAETSFSPTTPGGLTTKSWTEGYVAGELTTFGAALNAAIAAGYQPLDSQLTALAVLGGGADKLPYFTGAATMAMADTTSFGRGLLNYADRVALAKALGVPVILAQEHSTTQSGSTAETTVMSYTVAANTLGTKGGIELRCTGWIRNNSGFTGQLTVVMKWGGTTIYSDPVGVASNATQYRPFELILRARNRGSTSLQWVTGSISMGTGGQASGGGEGNFGAIDFRNLWSPADGVDQEADTTGAVTAEIALTMNIANINYQWFCKDATATLLPGV